MEYCTGLFVWGLAVCAYLVVGGLCVAEVRDGGLRCLGLCVFVIKSLRRLWVFSLVLLLLLLLLLLLYLCSTSGPSWSILG